MRQTGSVQPIRPVSGAGLTAEQDMPFNSGRVANWAPRKKSRAHYQRVNIFENWNGPMLRPRFIAGCASPHRHVESAAQIFVQGRHCRHQDFDIGVCIMEACEPRNQPAHSEAGWCAYPENTTRTGPPACLRRYRETIEA